MAASLLKGFDVEEAALAPGDAGHPASARVRPSIAAPRSSRRASRRPGSRPAVGALAASTWLGLFAFRHVDYAHELWWRFELTGEASRFLRASVGAAVVVLLVGLARLVGPSPHEVAYPDDATLDAAAGAIVRQTSTAANLVFLRDKGVLFDDARDAFVMYAVQRRTWVAMGDPVGPDRALVRR